MHKDCVAWHTTGTAKSSAVKNVSRNVDDNFLVLIDSSFKHVARGGVTLTRIKTARIPFSLLNWKTEQVSEIPEPRTRVVGNSQPHPVRGILSSFTIGTLGSVVSELPLVKKKGEGRREGGESGYTFIVACHAAVRLVRIVEIAVTWYLQMHTGGIRLPARTARERTIGEVLGGRHLGEEADLVLHARRILQRTPYGHDVTAPSQRSNLVCHVEEVRPTDPEGINAAS